ncbi:glucose-1-phosphate thymidylyltransferase RfbA [Sphingomonas sp.]|uniref:glucose-1-phosphate thymidylyltransferase RfbA n=1 Tax=Sphingomonas sp. TaxID=28214 RepID=UPI001E187F33|nr:glucose-1-phosphate thymidylyltransferase RfbA [Sphingomonas sp.]MBX9797366.1 glucose-1-phosphate thymidylyltransferase RfbA [Sphingomonas sp.]
MQGGERKGIILAGGSGTRLYPATLAISKQLLPVFDKPMIYYPLSVLMLAGIRDIMIISTPRDLPMFQLLLGDGAAFGIRLHYAAQDRPEGLPQAFTIAEEFLAGGPSALILGDNIFHGDGLAAQLRAVSARREGATVFAHQVADPERYGVVAFDAAGRPARLVEKPATPPSDWALTGLYFCDGEAPALARALTPSARGETEIVDLLSAYLARGTLDVARLGRGFAWLDTGTHESLHEAASLVRAIEHRQGVKIACPEEIGLDLGYLCAEQVRARAEAMGRTGYADYLRRRAAA